MTTVVPPVPETGANGPAGLHTNHMVNGDVHVLTAHEEVGVHKTLKARHVQMIALGSAIGTGLLLGSGSRLEKAGPSLAILYLVCGIFGYIILRNLGELVAYRPSSGSFVSYAREFYGEKMAYVVGWLYWSNWAMVAIADATAVAIYLKWFGQYSPFIEHMPQWVLALSVVVMVVATNMFSAKIFGELEFWFSLIKVVALVAFMCVAIWFILFGHPTGQPVGFSLISDAGGWMPNGFLAAVVVMQGVVFAYAGIELVGTTAGETPDAPKLISRAINTVVGRIIVFYFGCVMLLCLALPYTEYKAGESPFVTFFTSIGFSQAAPIMEIVVITAALSSLNAGMYSTGRILRSMSQAGSAPKFVGLMSKQGVPYGGILLTAAVALLGVVLNYMVPSQAFEIVLNLSALGVIAGWGAIVICHLKFVRLAKEGKVTRPGYRSPLAPYLNYLVLGFLGTVVVLIALDYPIGTYTLGAFVALIPMLVAGWFACRETVRERAAARDAYAAGSVCTPASTS